jgi:hypothetical protein
LELRTGHLSVDLSETPSGSVIRPRLLQLGDLLISASHVSLGFFELQLERRDLPFAQRQLRLQAVALVDEFADTHGTRRGRVAVSDTQVGRSFERRCEVSDRRSDLGDT